MNLISINYGNPNDIDPWMHLVHTVSSSFPGLETEGALTEHRRTVLDFMDRQEAICAKQDGGLVGILLFSRENNMLCFLAVDPIYRRQHIAEKLFRFMLPQMDADEPITVTTYREGVPEGIAARAFYQKLGFVPGKLTAEFGSEVQEFVLDMKQWQISQPYMMVRTDQELYCTLSQRTKDKSLWKENLPNVAALLKNHSQKITAKALWLLGEMGLQYPHEIASYVEEVAGFIQSENDLLRECAANALGRIGRADYELVSQHMDALLSLSRDEKPNVRLSFIWACENIATNTPEVFGKWVGVFEAMLGDENEKVRIEAPEILRVIGK